MILFHITTEARANAILAEGFRDSTASYMTNQQHTGVWLSDVPLEDIMAHGAECLLEVDTLEVSEDELTDYEWKEQGKGYREWLIPSALVNARMRVSRSRPPDRTLAMPP